MAKKKKQKRARAQSERKQTDASRQAPALDRLLFACALAGVAVTVILVWGLAQPDGLPYCGAESGCDVVQSSAWSVFFGVPLAVWGLGFYLFLAATVFEARRRRGAVRLALWLITTGLLISVYLQIVSATIIQSWCMYCLTSLAILVIAFAASFRPRYADARPRFHLGAVGTATLIIALMHANAAGVFKDAAERDPYLKALAVHLTERGVKFYGASWCPHCQQQKDLFGAASADLPYVECAPNGPRGPRSTECEVKEIRNYPTWIIDGRSLARMISPERLAVISGFPTREEWRGSR